jgi:hypothetical protein
LPGLPLNGPEAEARSAPRQWAPFLAATALLWLVLFLLYSSPLRTTFFFMDEILYLRPQPFPVLGAFWMPFVFGLSNGRPISYFIWGIYLGVASNWGGLHWIRVFHFCLGSVALSLLLYVLYRRSRSIFFASMVVLFLCTQPLMQVFFVISIVTTYWIAAGLGCAAFLHLHRHTAALRDWRVVRRPLVVAGVLLLAAWMTFQPGAFCGLALAGFFALTSRPESWLDERRSALALVALLMVTMTIYLVTYKLLLFVTGAGTYELVGPAFSTLTGSSIGTATSFLRASNYLGPFEWWNYIVPIEPLSDDRFRQLTSMTVAGCVLVVCSSCAIELQRADRRQVLEKYGIAVLCLLLTFLPVVADGFTMRQHIYIACLPAIVLMVAHGLSVVIDRLRLPRPLLYGVAAALLSILAWGAHAGFERALVQPTARYYAFARQQARRAAHPEFKRVAVVLPIPQCDEEPCRGMFYYRTPWAELSGVAESYRKIVQDETGRSDFIVDIVRPAADNLNTGDPTTLWIDNRELER